MPFPFFRQNDKVRSYWHNNNVDDNVGLLFQIIQAEINLISELYYLALLYA